MTRSHQTSRWKCPKCGSHNVQVAYPAWFTETQDYTLTAINTDGDADVLYWYCADCMDSEEGEPDETTLVE